MVRGLKWIITLRYAYLKSKVVGDFLIKLFNSITTGP